MEYLDIYMLADARNVQIVDENLEAISGLVTLFKDVPVTINLHMYDVYGEPYTEDALNNHIWSFIVAHDYNTTTTPQLRANAISVAGNVLKIEISNMNTVELNEQLKEEKSIRLGAELYGKSIEDSKDNWVMQFNVSIRNRRESNGIPTKVENNYYTKGEVDAKISGITLDVPAKVSELENDAGYITIEQVPEVDLSEYALKTDIPDVPAVVSAFTNDAGYITIDDVPVVDLSNYALKSEIPVVPTKTSELQNDSGYITLAQVPITDLTNYYVKSEVDGKLDLKLNITDAFSGSYNDLTDKPVIPVLPENITTLGNNTNVANGLVLIGEDGKIPSNLYDADSSTEYTAGNGITITDNKISVRDSGYNVYTDTYQITEIKEGETSNNTYHSGRILMGANSNNKGIEITWKESSKYNTDSYIFLRNATGITIGSKNGVRANNIYIDAKVYSGGTVSTSYVAKYENTGNIHTIALTAETACTLTTSSVPIYATLMVIVDNTNAGSLLFGSEEVISTAETGKYALVFSNLGSSIKLYNKIEV